MHETNILSIDLNLLKALQALLETGSVSRAAQQVNLSQPAMSRALDRLRHILKDPLLVRAGRSMMLTPRAEHLLAPVQAAVGQLNGVFAPAVFDPGKADTVFRLMAPDYLSQKIMPGVLAQVCALAPKMTIEIENLSAQGVDDMCEGSLSLGFGVVDDGPVLRNVASQALLTDRQVCLMRADHPLADGPISLEGYASASHALLSITGKGGGRIDDVLKKEGLSRRIAVRIPHFLTISAVIANTDLIITVPELLAEQVMQDGLCVRPLPEPLETPSFTVSQIWHERFTADPAHMWLRRIVKSVCRSF